MTGEDEKALTEAHNCAKDRGILLARLAAAERDLQVQRVQIVSAVVQDLYDRGHVKLASAIGARHFTDLRDES